MSQTVMKMLIAPDVFSLAVLHLAPSSDVYVMQDLKEMVKHAQVRKLKQIHKM